ncbi:MAG: DUF1501 domain-containing protein [Armatimonadetes bacterium]|nr:DUF1501 domain-containing protein [Armatimonadota bacterium]
MSELISRRDAIKRGGLIAVGLVAPRWLSTIAEADVLQVAKGGKIAKDTVLVVCQFSGGNDGLNTVIPYANKLYYQMRPTIGIEEDKVVKLNDQMGLHPAMAPLGELYKQGKVAIVQNVGYPQPNRSHFKSMDIWQSASPDSKLRYGWIGRHMDFVAGHGTGNPVYALGLSTEKPLALAGKTASVPCFASLADIQAMIGDPDSERMLRAIQGMDAKPGSPESVVQQANKTALDAMDVLATQLQKFTPKQTYGTDPFGQGFKQISQLIATSPQTRIVYFSTGGFDTHARQIDTQNKLLGNFANAVSAFQAEMEACGRADKVVVLVFSEFGRRVAENGSQGTDHGAAGPMLLIGKKVKGGLHGANPDLANLMNGDLKYQIDFRQVYASTLDTWIGGDSGVVLGQQFQHVDVY